MRLRVATLAVAASLAGAAPAAADTFSVTGFGDALPAPPCASAGGSGTFTCSTLRGAVDQANAVAGEDGIVLGPGDYTVTAGDILISGDVQILGAGPRQTTLRAIDTAEPVITVAGGASVALSLMTVGGGTENVRVSGGSNATFIYTRITAATSSGGIVNEGSVTLTHSLVDANAGGGVDNIGLQGQPARVSVLNSTIAANAGPGVRSRGAADNEVTLLHATIARNTGSGLSFDGLQNATADASIISDNAGGANCSGGSLSGEFNVESTTSCALSGRNRMVTDPLLAAALSNQGGFTDVLAIPADSPAVDYVSPCIVQIDQRPFNRVPSLSGPCDAGAYEQSGTDSGLPQDPPPQPTPPPTPAPPPTTPPAPLPVVNQTAVAREVRGTVKVQLPGTRTFTEVDATRAIPMGSTIDTRKGAVELTSVPRAGAPPEKAIFYDGLFRLNQSRGITNLTLVEALDCGRRGRASAAQKKAKKRRLWGDGKGSFRTTGKYSAATVRGTKWLVEDTCTTTTTRVTQGSVTVQHGKKRVIVRAGKRYVARAKR